MGRHPMTAPIEAQRLRLGLYAVTITDEDGDSLNVEVDDRGIFIMPDQDVPNGLVIKGELFTELLRMVRMCIAEASIEEAP